MIKSDGVSNSLFFDAQNLFSLIKRYVYGAYFTMARFWLFDGKSNALEWRLEMSIRPFNRNHNNNHEIYIQTQFIGTFKQQLAQQRPVCNPIETYRETKVNTLFFPKLRSIFSLFLFRYHSPSLAKTHSFARSLGFRCLVGSREDTYWFDLLWA